MSKDIVEDPVALSPDRRTQVNEEYDEGILSQFEPITVLRRESFTILAEIVRVRTCSGGDDWVTSYLINLVSPGSKAGALAVEYDPRDRRLDTYGLLLALLEDAEAYIEGLEGK